MAKPQKEERNLEKRNLPQQAPVSFDAWWNIMCGKYDFGPALKTAVEHHFKARGFWEKGDWYGGIKDFGYHVQA